MKGHFLCVRSLTKNMFVSVLSTKKAIRRMQCDDMTIIKKLYRAPICYMQKMAAAINDAARALATVVIPHSLPEVPKQTNNINNVIPLELQPNHFKVFQSFPGARFASSIKQQLYVDSIWRQWHNLMFRCGRDPRLPQSQRKKIVVLGTGWGAMNFVTRLDVTKYDVTIVSPRNFFTFTPLLPSVCAGTLSPRSCLEPVRNKMLRGGKKVMEMYEAFATDVDNKKKVVYCKALTGEMFELNYDYLVVAVGSETNTFNIPGVTEFAYFLKEVSNAREIHKKLLDSFEQASLPNVSEEEKKQLLHFVVVGAGPTGVETAAELMDFAREDAGRHFPDLIKHFKVSLIEMLPKVLPVFSPEVSEYTIQNLKRLNIDIRLQCRVTKITKDAVHLQNIDGESYELPYGLVLWASGVQPVPLAKKIMSNIEEQKSNRIMKVDEKLQIIGMPDCYAMGDCVWLSPRTLVSDTNELYSMAEKSADGASTDWLMQMAPTLSKTYPQIAPSAFDFNKNPKKANLSKEEFREVLRKIDTSYRPPPPTAQVANQEGRHLAVIFNRYLLNKDEAQVPSYIYQWSGQMAYVGGGQSVIQTPNFGDWLGGRTTNIFWKMFYWSQQMSYTNRFICTFDWCRAVLRGRDLGREQTKDILRALPPSSQP